jgi:hypothetical protein
MPNQPMPDEEGEIQFNGALGTDHVEGQYSNAVLPYFATYAGGYKAFKGITQYEVGGMFYTPFAKDEKVFFDLGGGYGHGNYTNYNTYLGNNNISVNSVFNAFHIQSAIYFDLSSYGRKIKFGLCYKRENVHFLSYNITQNREPTRKNSVNTVLLWGDDNTAIVNTYYISVQKDLNYSGLYWRGQFGVKAVEGFQPRVNPATQVPKDLIKAMHPYVFPIMINFSVGYRFNVY